MLEQQVKNKSELPYYMASMNKIKPDTKELDKWLKKYTSGCLITTKLDGVSGLYTTEDSWINQNYILVEMVNMDKM